jgi:hemerythrin-like domain-containing protein
VRPILGYMESDHQRCDAFFAQLEGHIERREWERADFSLRCFKDTLERHLAREETILFPAFEEATGGSSEGPTSVMRVEHKYIRAIVSRVCDSVGQRDENDFFGHAEILRNMLQQHNLKEESILYAMIDRILSGRQDEIIDAMDAVAITDAPRAIDSIG